MDIGEVAKQTGLTAATLRYYEKIGLIQSTGRHGLRRVFANDVVQKLQLIVLLKNNAFSLMEIKQMLTQTQVDRQYLLQKTAELQQTIKALDAICNTLTHIAHCPKQDHFKCSNFRQLLDQSTQQVLKTNG